MQVWEFFLYRLEGGKIVETSACGIGSTLSNSLALVPHLHHHHSTEHVHGGSA